jgi:hypothetical protein
LSDTITGSVSASTIGTLTQINVVLTGDALPANSIVVNGRLYVITPLTSGGAATAAIQLVNPNDIIMAAVVSGSPWTPSGDYATIPIDTAITDVANTAGGTPALVIAVADLLTGEFDLFLDYIVTD